jgi:uncharacterized membrane protein YtjA (UPF0391 family)
VGLQSAWQKYLRKKIFASKRHGTVWANGTADGVNNKKEVVMLGWTLMFLIIALVAGVLGFTGIAGAAVGIARILFFIFLVLFLASLVLRLMNG